MSQSTNTIRLLSKAGIEALRSSEAVSVLPSALNIATDPSDDLYCPGVDDPPSPGLVKSMRNGWLKGNSIFCVNRGTKEMPIPYIVAGRSRKKSADLVNEERAAQGLEPMRVDIVFVSSEDAYSVMLLENNRQERGPLFNARRWQQHRRVYARRIGKAILDASDLVEARREFSELIDCSESTIAGWEKMLENPPEVLAMIERGEISPTDAKELVRHIPEAKRTEKAVEIAARKSESNGSAKNGTSKKAHRDTVLGKRRTFTAKEIRALTVGSSSAGLERNDVEAYRHNYGDEGNELDALICKATADGFALFGKLVTGEIGIDDLPSNLRTMANEILNGKRNER